MEPAGYFCITSDHEIAGFLDEECFSTLVFRHCYNAQKKISPADPLIDLFRESALRSYFVLSHAGDASLMFHRFDEEGFEISGKSIALRKHESRFLPKEPSALYSLACRTLFDGETPVRKRFVFIRRINSEFPEEILLNEPFNRLDAAMRHIGARLPVSPA
jgi:hypothetical protein